MKSLISLVLQSLAVVAGVLVFSYFDPFGILAPKKKTLQDTPISVESIKEIGQLVTAEYYGEVLSSLHETFVDDISGAPLATKLDTLNLKFIKALSDFRDGKDTIPIKVRWYRKRKDLVDYFHSSNPELSNNPFYQKMIVMIIDKLNKKNYNYGSEGEILKAIWKGDELNINIKSDFKLNKQEINASLNEEAEKLKRTKTYRKRQIIAIGRGWVKAGVDFGNFHEGNFKYDKDHNTIYLFGVEAKILDYDINPWFNADAKIKGFEIIAATNQANRPDYLEQVKESCLAKLKTQAENAGIVKQAQTNAVETLKHFFSLLLGNPVDRVLIYKSSPETYLEELAKNEIIPKEQLTRIDSTLLSLDSMGTSLFANRTMIKISKLKFIVGRDTFSVGRYSSLVSQILSDRLITKEEWSLVKKVCRDTLLTRLDSLWFFPYKNYSQLIKRANQKADSILPYRSTGVRHLYDSLIEDSLFIRHKEVQVSQRKQMIKQEMSGNRERALREALTSIETDTRDQHMVAVEEELSLLKNELGMKK